MQATPRGLRVGDEDGGRRLDLFLAEKLGLSRSQTRRLLARGAVAVDGRPVTPSAKGVPLAPGQAVSVAPFTRPEQQRAVATPDAPLALLAEGPGWLAVDKPAGVPVHPLREDETGTLANALAARHPAVHGVGEGGLASGVVHRLDVDTSGVLLFASEEAAWQRLRAAFREHRADKLYRAIVLGRVATAGEVRVGLVTARHRPARVRVLDASELERTRGARPAELSFRPLAALAGATLLEVRPRQGHLHQIRATLAHLGHPVAGDRSYGPPDDPTGAPRQLLHAAELRVEEVEVTSPDPEDFAALLAALG